MAPAPTTSAFIPPPPLPEYYQKQPKVTVTVRNKQKEEAALSTPSAETDMQALVVKTKTTTKEKTSKQDISTAHAKAQIGIPIYGDAADARMTTKHMAKYDVPPLAVYHICRICLRPRSNRYHREHPIPINGVPPPPGICRRCRVKKVEEREVVEEDVEIVKLRDERSGCPNLFQAGESNDIRIGVSAFIPATDLVSAEEASKRRDREVLRKLEHGQRIHKVREVREESSESEEETRRITYRHVHVQERSVSPTPQAAAADVDQAPIAKPRTSARSTAQDAIDAVSLLSQEPVMITATAAAASMEVQPTATQPALIAIQAPSTKSESADMVEAHMKKEDVTTKTYLSPSYPASRSDTRTSVQVAESSRPSFTESDIRRLAREEVVKFRHAERKLEAHPDAYAHGRLIPVERRIEKARDVQEPRPWEEVEVRVVKQFDSGNKFSSQAAYAAATGRERDVKDEYVAQRSQRSAAKGRSIEPVGPEAESTSEDGKCSHKSHTSMRDFAYEAYTHARSASARSEKHIEKESERPEPHPEPSVKEPGAGWSGARSHGQDQREVIVEYERSSRPESRRTHKPTFALQEVEQAPRAESRSVYESTHDLQDAKQSSRTAQSTTVVTETERGGAQTRHATRGFWNQSTLAESDPPVSVKLREVLSWDPAQRFEATDRWQEPAGEGNIIEVIEEIEQPRLARSRAASRVSARVREPKEDADREERATSVRSTTWSESGYLHNDSAAKTASRNSAVFRGGHFRDRDDFRATSAQGLSSERTDPSQKSQKLASLREWDVEDDKTMWPGSCAARTSRSAIEKEELARSQESTATSRQPIDGLSEHAESRQRAFGRRMAAVELQDAKSHDMASTRSESRARPSAQQLRDSQPLHDNEYIWTRRVIRPLNDNEERASYDDLPAKHRMAVDQFFGQSFEPIKDGYFRKSGRPADHWVEVGGRLEAGKPIEKRSAPEEERVPAAKAEIADVRLSKKPVRRASPPEGQPSRAQQQRRHYRRETKGSPSSTSTRVRFASKVDVSPTPPGSEASSTQFRIIGGRGGSRKRVDDESGEDLIAEYKNRGRTRVRRDRRHHEPIEEEGLEHFYEKKQSAIPDAEPRKDAVNRWDGADESQYRPRKSRPLHRALSESPSRERLAEPFSGSAKTIELAGAYQHRERWGETVKSIEREGSGKW